MSQKERIIIDTDAGVDDAMAILLALNSPELEVIGFTTVHGNAELSDCTKNVLRLLDLTGRQDIPVAVGADAPLIRKPTYGKFVHGDDGFGDVDLPYSSLTPIAMHGVEFLEEMVNKHPGEITIVALGPLTNLALAIGKDRSFARKVKHVIFMGGTYLERGNATSVATANLFHDPHAARIVYDSGVPLTSVGLDGCRKFYFKEEHVSQFSLGNKYGKYIDKISSTIYIERYSKFLGFRGFQSNDTPSIGYLIAPQLYKTATHHVDIEIIGEFSTGQTVIDYNDTSEKSKNVTIVTSLDGPALRDLFFKRVIYCEC
ncbi:MAG: nucleoside hydrolase [Bacteroidetes bacterium]|nr:nucleoside hydrolase [Bacteroidota bacterium]